MARPGIRRGSVGFRPETSPQGIHHGPVDLVTAGADARPDHGHDAFPGLGMRPESGQSGGHHPGRDTPPTRMNRDPGPTRLGGRKDGNAIRGDDSDRDPGPMRNHGISVFGVETTIGPGPGQADTVNLVRP